MSLATVKFHVKNVLPKLGVAGRTERQCTRPTSKA
ncbi:LuxR C-terminal-related transcriptional regulator [Rhodococcus opacus]